MYHIGWVRRFCVQNFKSTLLLKKFKSTPPQFKINPILEKNSGEPPQNSRLTLFLKNFKSTLLLKKFKSTPSPQKFNINPILEKFKSTLLLTKIQEYHPPPPNCHKHAVDFMFEKSRAHSASGRCLLCIIGHKDDRCLGHKYSCMTGHNHAVDFMFEKSRALSSAHSSIFNVWRNISVSLLQDTLKE